MWVAYQKGLFRLLLACCLQHFILRRVLKERRGQQVGPHPHFSNGQNMGAFHGHFSWLFNHHIRSDLFCKDWTWHQAFDVRNLDKSNVSITLAISLFFFLSIFFFFLNGSKWELFDLKFSYSDVGIPMNCTAQLLPTTYKKRGNFNQFTIFP